MDLTQILITIISACIPALISYLAVTKQSNFKLKEIEKSNENELVRLKQEYDFKLKELDAKNSSEIERMRTEVELNSKNNENEMISALTNDILRGDLDLGKLQNALSGVDKLKSKFPNNNKR